MQHWVAQDGFFPTYNSSADKSMIEYEGKLRTFGEFAAAVSNRKAGWETVEVGFVNMDNVWTSDGTGITTDDRGVPAPSS